MSGSNHSQDRTRNGWAILVGIVVTILLLSGCTGETPRVYRVGVLVGADTMSDVVDVFKAGMTELGYVEGEDITYDVQSSNADLDEAERIADKFATDQVDLVFVFPGQSARTVKAALQGTNIPIVFANAIIEGTDLVDSVRSPGGNITGVRIPGPEIVLKNLESLLEFTPRFERIMIIYDPNYPTTPPALEALRSVALSSNVTLQEVHVIRLQDTQAVLQGLEESGDDNMDAIMLLQDSIPQSSEAFGLILEFADAHRVPIVGGPDNLVQDGGVVLSATTDVVETGELAASLADRILKGTPAGTIPVVSPQPHLYINYTKAQELGLTVPQGLLKQAVEIIR
jgi:putative ABC transport system substrate-binding protein